MDQQQVAEQVAEVAGDFAANRAERQLRRHLDPADFQRLAEAGFVLTGVPSHQGGLWTGVASSTRPIADLLRQVAAADASVALVCSMHPAVLSFWLTLTDPPDSFARAWAQQTEMVTTSAKQGHWWGTITSEPGSGGDVGRTKAVAKREDGGYKISGSKHFGSGSGITSFMITTAVPEGESEADWFFMDVGGVPWDGTRGIRLTSEWNGQGMIATQSHAMEFDDFPATRISWPGNLRVVSGRAGAFIGTIFTSVIVGVALNAVELARPHIKRRKDTFGAFEKVEWVRIENEAWLIEQAYEGMLRAVEAKGEAALIEVLRGKTTVAELAESLTSRLCRVIGGATFHRSSPFGAAFEDVRALGFLRPPWPLAYDLTLNASLEAD